MPSRSIQQAWRKTVAPSPVIASLSWLPSPVPRRPRSQDLTWQLPITSFIASPAGLEASIATSSGGIAIIINAGAGDTVALRGLHLDSGGVDAKGIVYNSGGVLEIVDCVVSNFVEGIEIIPTTSGAFTVLNTMVFGSGNGAISIAPQGSSTLSGVVSKAVVHHNKYGIVATVGEHTTAGNLSVSIVDSTVSNNTNDAIMAGPSRNGTRTEMLVRNTSASNNSVGVIAFYNSSARLTQTSGSGNKYGIYVQLGGTIYTFNDNHFSGNTTDVQGSLTSVAPQ